MKRLLFSFVILTALAGCAADHFAQKPASSSGNGGFVGAPVETPSAVEPPKPKYNLSGFPLTYRQGYDDGCNSAKDGAQGAERKDAQRFAHDANYRTGWQDGYALCTPKK
ncbi:MAG: membrane lipoprotein lipid attachment site-containing protein [Burkholderiales bacterium]|jgi:hypothetical protein|nr:membrane lipoprotein lipid attachment site-containing protein [Burkholderiales bacterium]